MFFGEPEFESADLLQLAPDGRGLVSLVELPQLQDRPSGTSPSRSLRRGTPPTTPKDHSVVEQVVKSDAFEDFMRTAAREIARGVFKTGRR